MKEVGAAILCQRESGLLLVDLEGKIVLQPARMPDCAPLVDELTK